MDQAEIEEAVKELETLVDRLRSLYEQYFMGIEKLEPGVPKKDVERRVQALRREQIRNTALRFRFQMILQRYNTYLSYWLRICRQIDEGTYKRDVLRVKARLADEAKKKTATRDRNEVALDLDELTANFEDIDEALRAPPAPPPPKVPGKPPALPPRAPGAVVRPASSSAPPLPLAAAKAQGSTAATAPGATTATGVAATTTQTGARGFGAVPKATQSTMKMLATRLKASNPSPAGGAPIGPPTARRIGVAPAASPEGSPARAPAPSLPEASPPRASAPSLPEASPPRAPAPSLSGALPPRPAATASPPVASPPRPTPLRRSSAPPPPRRASSPPTARRPSSRPPAPRPGPAPTARTAENAARPAPPPQPSANASAQARVDLSDERVRQLYSQYVDTKRKQNESTAAITYDNLAKTLRESSAKLKEKHAGKSVDFEVTIKDGKTILKPVVREAPPPKK